VLHAFVYLILISVATAVIYFFYYILNVYYLMQKRSDPGELEEDTERDVTIIVPVYDEKVEVFERAIDRISVQGSRFVVIGDSSYEPYRSITEEKGGIFVHLEERRGKRIAISEGMKYVETKYVMFVDSDTVIQLDAVKKMLMHFRDNTGGVGANVSVRKTENGASYSSEFMERTREVILRAMSTHGGSVMVIDGKCAMYRSSLVKPLLLSDEFRDYRVGGKPTMMGDDQQMTAYVIKNGYKATKCFDVVVETEPPENFKQFTRQSIRWARSSYYHFFKNLKDGTAKKAGAFYTFETVSTFLLPIITFGIGFFRLYLELHLVAINAGNISDAIADFISYNLLFTGRGHFIHILTYIGIPGPLIFGSAVAMNLRRERLRTLGYGGVALVIIFFTSLYGFITCWKQSKWLTR
jgi:cellulose synthase/poly-beta-1,6-N-acetylglucosamine synthase-like glycosyltransferase